MTRFSSAAERARRTPPLLLAVAMLLAQRIPVSGQAAPSPPMSSASIARAHLMGRVSSAAPVRLALTLSAHHQPEMDDLLRRLYDPHDPLYGRYLTPDAFTALFGPTAAEYQAVAAYAQAQGLSIIGTHPNRMVLDVAGPAGAVEAAFGVRLRQYRATDGRVFHAPDTAPSAPATIAPLLAGVIGLDTSAVLRPHARRLALPIPAPGTGPGTGPRGGLTPSDTKTAYGLNGVTLDGRGQTLAVFELAGYTLSDIRGYEDAFGLPHTPVENVLVDGATGQPGFGADEATLDIELVGALAPRASKIIVYEGLNSNASIIDTYNKIANENRAKAVSTSWGLAEDQNDAGFLNSENTIFKQMAMQGQSVFAAAGDAGAFDDGTNLSVDDPASQPFVTGVGGTTATTHGPGGTYLSETTWNTGPSDAGGGGISSHWPIPSYQSQAGVITAKSLGSTTMRNVPDVSLNADPTTGYAIYYQGGWTVFGGASTSTPLWTSFTALVNQQRQGNGLGYLGFVNPAIYGVGVQQQAATGRDFHDVADGSSNGKIDGDTAGTLDPNGQFVPATTGYPAVPGYDLATGWGSFQGANLIADLSGGTVPAPLAAPFTFPAGLNMISLPDTYSGVPLAGLFGGATPYYIWDPLHGVYNTLAAPQAQPGQGYWVRFPAAVTVTQSGNGVTPTTPATISLAAGWNQIGDPFASQVAVADLQVLSNSLVYSFTAATGNTALVSSLLYRYDTASGQYAGVDITGALTPGTGYWLYATQAVTLQVPPP